MATERARGGQRPSETEKLRRAELRLTVDRPEVRWRLLRISLIKTGQKVRQETIINVFPSNDESHRLVIAVEQESGCRSRLVLRQETFADDLGWFVQSRVPVEPEQVAGLRMSLASPNAHGAEPVRRERPKVPAILRFDGAHSGAAS